MIQSIFMMGGLGVLIGTALVIASKAFYVYEDPKVVAIDDVLPGANCGGCGLPGCTANAEAIVNGEADVNSCVAAGEDVANAIAAIMGVSVSDKEPEFAGAGCFYGNNDADLNYTYQGIQDCRAAAMLMGGMKVCRIGCLGLGTCVSACKFDALVIGEDGLPKVDKEKCTSCGACERICPKNIIRVTSMTRRVMREYTRDDCVTPCQRACPSGIDIKEYVRLIKEGDYEGSLQVIKERMPFPTVISRICPALCEFDCRRLHQDESVSINGLKRFVCDYEMNRNERVLPYKAPATGKKVAVIGGGVEGLSAAYFTARLGHTPSVFERTGEFGGILRTAITRERLSMDVLDWDVRGIEEMGVNLVPNMKTGVDFTIPGLLDEGYDAVFTATGGWDSRLSRGEADTPVSVFPGAHLLIDLIRSDRGDKLRVETGKTIVVAGDGEGLAQAVKILKNKGAQKVYLVTRESEADADIPADAGVTLIPNAGITRVSGEDEALTSVGYADLTTGETRELAADTLIIGAGRFPELVFVPAAADECLPEEDGEETPEAEAAPRTTLVWAGMEVPKKPDNNRELGLLSDQDIISEYRSAVSAINGGRRAATAMHHIMYDIPFQDGGVMITPKTRLQDVDSLELVELTPRNVFDIAETLEKRNESFSTGFSSETAHSEAERCLRCGLVCYEKNCIAG